LQAIVLQYLDQIDADLRFVVVAVTGGEQRDFAGGGFGGLCRVVDGLALFIALDQRVRIIFRQQRIGGECPVFLSSSLRVSELLLTRLRFA